MTLFSYEIFDAVARQGSFNKAAQQLHLTPSAISHAIAVMEEALSIREKYDKGYWLQLYLYKDLEYLFTRNQDVRSLEKLNKAYYTGDWSILL